MTRRLKKVELVFQRSPWNPSTTSFSTWNWILCQFRCLAKDNPPYGFFLKNIEDGTCRHLYAYGRNNTFIDRSKLLSTEIHDVTNMKKKLQKMNIVDQCTKERSAMKRKFYHFTKFTVFASLLKYLPLGSKDTVTLEILLKNHIVIYPFFGRNTR